MGASIRASLPRPVLRGWIHLASVPVALAGAWTLLRHDLEPGRWWSVLVFSTCLTGLYAVSALYHVPPWNRRVRAVLSRCDGAMIQLFIAGTFTPIGFTLLSGAWRAWSLLIAWAVAVVGAVISASPLRAPRWLSTLGYIAFGWLGVVPFIKIMAALPWEASSLIALGGVLYTLGAVVYATRRPDPLPAWFGFHEVFHLLVVAGSTAHWLVIWRFVVPH